jgi:transposase
VKHSSDLLTVTLMTQANKAVNIMLLYSADIMGANCLKEKFFTALRSSAEQAEAMLSEWIHIAEISLIKDFRYCARTLKSWFNGIISSFAYGYRNFRRFRNRILHIFSHQKLSRILDPNPLTQFSIFRT